MDLADDLHRMPARERRRLLVEGHPIDPAALEGWAYRGISLGLPRLVERLSWKTFQKVFHRDGAGRLVGWNVRLEQDGVSAPSRPRRRGGVPVTTWHFEVVSPAGTRTPPGFDRGLIIDYGRRRQPIFDTMRFARDPLVALDAGSADKLLGVTWLAVGAQVETPTWFLLEREHPVEHVPEAVRDGSLEPIGLTDTERRWAEQIFSAVLDRDVAELDRAFFWRALGTATPAYFGPGLRGMIWALNLVPLGYREHRRPFSALDPGQRMRCLARMDEDPRPSVRGLLTTMKLLACFLRSEGP